MITFEINDIIFMVYQIYGVYTGTVLTPNRKYVLPFCYVLPTEAEAELIKLYNQIRDNEYAQELK